MSANRSDPNAEDPSPARPADQAVRDNRERDVAIFGFALAFAVLLVGGALGYVNATRLDANRRQVAHARETIAALETLLSTLKDAETGQRGYLLVEDEKYLGPYEDALGRVESDLQKIAKLAHEAPDDRDRLIELRTKTEAKLDELAETVALAASGNHAGAVEIVRGGNGRVLMDEVRDEVAELEQIEREILLKRDAESLHSYRMTIASIGATALLALSLICLSTYLIWRNLQQKRSAALVLAEQKERLRTTLASIGDAVISADREGNVTYLNGVAEKLTGWTNADAVGLPLTQVFNIVNETTRKTVENPALRALREGVIVGLANHTILIAKDGVERPIDDSAAPIRSETGDTVGCVLVFRDITERKLAEAESEAAHRQLATTLESIADGFFSVDRDWRFSYVNDEAGKLLFRTPGELVGKSLWDERPHLRGSEVEKMFHRVAAGGRPESFTALDPKTSKWFDLSVYPSMNGLSVHFRDATERIEAEKALREREEFNRSLMDGSPDCVKILDLDGRLLHMNGPGLCVMEIDDFGPVCGHVWTDLWPAESTSEIERAMASARGGTSYQFQAFCPTAKGTPKWWEVSVSPVRNAADGLVVRLLAISRDVTERRQADESLRESEERLRQLAADLSEADRRKDEFLATLAHELRNPLAPIRNGLQLLQMVGDDPETSGHAVTMMDRQVTQLVRLVDDLMDVSRINQGKLTLRIETLDLAAVVRSAVETSRPLIDDMSHELTVALPEQPVWVMGDLTRLAQALMNLLNNSAKYSERGGKIRLTVESREGDAVVSVRDEGIGIAEDQLPRVFDIFSQVDRSLERSRGGLGIGLSLVKRIVEMHGGTIEARSEGEGRGSEFVIRLPLLKASVPDSSAQTGDSTGERSLLRILVVDDNQDSANSLAKLLRAMGHEALVAYDGERAVEMAGESQPDVILLDIGLPKLNGYEACARIRRQPGGKDIVIVAQTGWGQAEDRRRTQESGFDRHLVKPIDPAELKRLLADSSKRSGE